jgi:hypothetical protein
MDAARVILARTRIGADRINIWSANPRTHEGPASRQPCTEGEKRAYRATRLSDQIRARVRAAAKARKQSAS